jgi:hypothetical protein
MKRAHSRSTMPILRAYLASESREVCGRLAGRIAKFVIEKAIAGHFGYFKLALDLVDGKLYRTAEDEMTFEPECVLVVADDWRDSATALAA